MEFQTGGFLPETPPDAGGEFAAPHSGFLFKVFFRKTVFLPIFCGRMTGMSKEIVATVLGAVAVLVAVFMMAWVIRGDIAANTAAINELSRTVHSNTAAISANTAAIAKLEGALLAHVGGHSHSAKIATSDS